MTVPGDDRDLANALARADASHPPAPGLDWSPAALQAAVRHRRQRRLLLVGLATTTIALLAMLVQPPIATDDDTLALHAEVRALQAELQALRSRLQPVAAARPEPTERDRTTVRLELARAGAEACRAFAPIKEIR